MVPRFSWDFNFGHVLTAVSIAASVLGGGLIAYSQVDRELVNHDTRLSTLERVTDQQATEERAFQQRTLDVLMEIRDRLGHLEGQANRLNMPPRP